MHASPVLGLVSVDDLPPQFGSRLICLASKTPVYAVDTLKHNAVKECDIPNGMMNMNYNSDAGRNWPQPLVNRGERMLHNHLPGLITVMIVLIACGCPNQDLGSGALTPLTVDDVDSALDGGSILFMLSETIGEEKAYVLCVHPDSAVLGLFFPNADRNAAILVSTSDMAHPEKGELMDDTQLAQLLGRLSMGKSEDEMGMLTLSVIAYLERISIHNEKPIYWGYNAVETLIKKGRGADCFKVLDGFFPQPEGY